MKLDPRAIQHEIHNLLTQNPELAEDDQLRADMVEGETDAFDFLSMLTRKIGQSRALAESINAYANDIKERGARIERRIEAFRALAFKIMHAADLKKAELPEATLSIRAGTQKVIITDEAALPDFACRFKREPDKTLIKEVLQDGIVPVPGAVLSNAEPALSIRIK
jgi:hypothetical protein